MIEFTDKIGRKIVIKEPTTLERVNFFRLLGPADCSNPLVISELTNAAWLKSVDGEPMPKKQWADIEFIVNLLEKGDADGMITQKRIEIFQEKQNKTEEDAELIKK